MNKKPEVTIKSRLLLGWLKDFDYENWEVTKVEKMEFDATGQNPYGVERYDFDVWVDIFKVGRKVFQLRFARSGESLKFHLVFERVLLLPK